MAYLETGKSRIRMRKTLKDILRAVTPFFIRRIFYGRIKACRLNEDRNYNKQFYDGKMSRGWADPYDYFHDLRCRLMAESVKSGPCLDIGSGNGQTIGHLSPDIIELVTGSDISLDSIIGTSKKFPGAAFVCFDTVRPSFRPDSFETVLMGEVLEHLHSPEQILKGIYELLKPGGRLILSVPTKYGLFGIIYDGIWTALRGGYNQDGHVQRFTSKVLRNYLEETGFRIDFFMNYCFVGFFVKSRTLIDLDL